MDMFRLKDVMEFNSIKTGPFGSDLKVSDYVSDGKYKVYTQENIISNDFSIGDKYITEDKYNKLKSCKINNGEILVSTRGTLGVFSLLNSQSFELGIIHSSVIKFKLKKNKNNSFFLYQLNHLPHIKQYILNNSSVNAIPALYSRDIKEITIYNPTLVQQTKIANYLDTETSKIDRKISILEQKYEKLEEYKQSVIFETVTKGLDNNVAMKDSGIDWIGNIPDHWEVKRVKDILSNLGGGNYGDDEDKEGLLLPCISISDFKNGNLENNTNIKMNRIYKKKNIIKQGSILIEKSGGGEKVPVGRVIYAKKDIEAYYTNFVQGIKIIKNNSNYIYYCLSAIHKNKLHMNFVKQTTGLQNFEFNKFSTNFLLPIPDIDSQKNISEYLDELNLKVDKKIEIIKKQIELLKEYKQSLIYEAVTGKLDIK